jgi:D-serine dehydratase
MGIDLHEIESFPLDGLTKGMPNGMAPLPLGEIGRKDWNILNEDLPLPAAVLKLSALAHNERWMSAFLAQAGAAFAPHGKTTMSPQLFARQLSAGAWAITVANAQQLEVCRRFGFPRAVLANQLVGRQAIRYVLDELERDASFEFYTLVDSVENVSHLAAAARGRTLKAPLNLLLEIGHAGGRTGCRDQATALAVARAVKAGGPALVLRGVECFEGLIHQATPEAEEDEIRALLDRVAAAAGACAQEDLFGPGPVILSAGGSAFYDLVAERFKGIRLGRETMLLTRSGCYVSHDSGLYQRSVARLLERSPALAALNERPQAALQIWAYVQSRPEPGKAILSLGKRDASFDPDLPVPELWYRPGGNAAPAPLGDGHKVTGMNDQHAHMAVPAASPLRVGDMVAFGISHPCLTFDKWQVLCLVDDAYNVVSAIRTFF